MKKILISLLISLLFSMNVYASDYTNYATWTENYWSSMDFFWTYDKNTELITLNFWKYLESNTTNKISITAKLLDDECSSEIEFKNFYLQWNCNIKVSKELFEPIAKAELIVSINEEPIYSWLHWITFEWYDAQILWNGLQTEAIQDISSTDLNLKTIEKSIGLLKNFSSCILLFIKGGHKYYIEFSVFSKINIKKLNIII